MAFSLTDTTDDLTKPQAPPEDDLSAIQPKKKPLAPGAPGGIPLSQPTQSPAGAAVTGAQMQSPDPLAFVPLSSASSNIVAPEQGYDSGLNGINPPATGGGPVTPPPPPTFAPTDTTRTSDKPTTAHQAPTPDQWTLLYGDKADQMRDAYRQTGADPSQVNAAWSTFKGSPQEVEAAKARLNQGADRLLFDEASREADQSVKNIQSNPAFRFGPGGDPNAQSQREWRNGFLRQAGFDPDTGQRVPLTPGNPSQPVVNGNPNTDPNDTPPGPFTSGPPSANVSPFGGGASQMASGPAPGVASTAINPDQSLLGQQFTPSNEIDRVKLAQDSLNSTIENVLNPAYQARLRDLNRYQFGAGRGVSGIARTSQGDVASDYGRDLAELSNQYLTGATVGSIDDLYRNLDEMQQERGFQKDLSDTAFGQSVTGAQLEDLLTNSAFSRAERTSAAGERGSPSDIALILSQIFGGQSSASMDAAARLFGGLGRNQGGGSASTGGVDIDSIISWLLSQKNGSGGGSTGGGTQQYPDD